MTSTSSSNNTATSIRTEALFVLYGSQTGNSEQAAEDFCKVIKEKYTPSYFRDLNLIPITVEPTCIQLDDFLDYRHAAFTKNLVIFVSSYGVGQAPIGSYKFRSFADELLSLVEITKNGGGDNKYATLLKGLRYAICGLGTFCICVRVYDTSIITYRSDFSKINLSYSVKYHVVEYNTAVHFLINISSFFRIT
jgi:sulfite reductase alpha subunit-like flavoprotein